MAPMRNTKKLPVWQTNILMSVFRLVIFFFSTYQQYKVIGDKFAKGVGKAVLQVSGEPVAVKPCEQ